MSVGRIRLSKAALVALVVAAVSVGCQTRSATKAGKSGGPVVLRLAARDISLDGDPAIADFVARVRRLSGGNLRIDVLPYWGNGAPDAERQIVDATAVGKVDLGVVG